MYLEHKPLHTSSSGDTILSLLGHTLGLKKGFFFVLLYFYHTPIPFPPNAIVKVKPGAHSSEILSVLLKSQANICALLTRNVTFPLKPPVAQMCSPVLLPGSPGRVWSLEGATPPSAGCQHSLSCSTFPAWVLNTWESFSIPTSRVLNISGLTTLIPGCYLNATFTSSNIAVKIVNT